MGAVVQMWDSLRNAVTGAGTRRDPRSANSYNTARPLMSQVEIDAAYRGSGLMRKIIQIPPMDMVREWREWETDKDTITLLEAEEKRLSLRQKIRLAETLRGLGGGALILGLPGNPSDPAPASVGIGGLAYIHVVSRWHLTFDALEQDARLPGYGEPQMWKLAQQGGQAMLHPSRVIAFRADTSALLATQVAGQVDCYWGESRVAQVIDAVSDSDAARGSFAAMLHKARLTRIGIPGLSETLSLPGGQAKVQGRLEVIALAESMFNASVYDGGEDGKSGESITDVDYTWTGAKDVMGAYAEFAAAISDIPATRLLGRAPEGMNSSGDSQQKDWNKRIKAMQSLELGPCLDRLDAYLIPSAGAPADATWQFEELDEADETAQATQFKTTVEAMTAIEALAVIPAEAFAKAVQNTLIEGGWMPGLETALNEVPEAERYGLAPDVEGDPSELTLNPIGGDPVSTGAGGSATKAPPDPAQP